jgi:hypothetical protein
MDDERDQRHDRGSLDDEIRPESYGIDPLAYAALATFVAALSSIGVVFFFFYL